MCEIRSDIKEKKQLRRPPFSDSTKMTNLAKKLNLISLKKLRIFGKLFRHLSDSDVTAYRVGKNRTLETAGPRTVYAQEWYNLRTKGHKNPNPRKQFIRDIKKQINQWTEQGHSVLLYMDANERMGEEQDGIVTLCADCGLIDPHEHFLNEPEPASYIRGKHRIDYCLCTRDVLNSIMDLNFEAFGQGPGKDHRGIIIDLDEDTLLGGKTNDLIAAASRVVSSKNPDHNKIYKDVLLRQLEIHRVEGRIQELKTAIQTRTTTAAHVRKFEKLDRTITEAMQHAENKCGNRKRKSPWMMALKKAMMTLRYWTQRITEVKT